MFRKNEGTNRRCDYWEKGGHWEKDEKGGALYDAYVG